MCGRGWKPRGYLPPVVNHLISMYEIDRDVPKNSRVYTGKPKVCVWGGGGRELSPNLGVDPYDTGYGNDTEDL